MSFPLLPAHRSPRLRQAHGALLLTSPLLRLLSAAAARCGLTPEAPLAVGRAVGGGLAAWGGRAAGDVGGLFASRSFGAAFVGLNLLHALLLRAVAVPLLARQGAAGEAAVMPVVSFVARSTGKVGGGERLSLSILSYNRMHWTRC